MTATLHPLPVRTPDPAPELSAAARDFLDLGMPPEFARPLWPELAEVMAALLETSRPCLT